MMGSTVTVDSAENYQLKFCFLIHLKEKDSIIVLNIICCYFHFLYHIPDVKEDEQDGISK